MSLSVVRLSILLGALGVPGAAQAKAWHGIVPGESTRRAVVKKFGSPDHEEGKGARYAARIVYSGPSVREPFGAAEAQFWLDGSGKVKQIYVIPAIDMTRSDVEAAWGKKHQERRTDDFRLYLRYPDRGFVVFFERGSEKVYQFVYTTPDGAKKPDGEQQAPTSSAARSDGDGEGDGDGAP